MTDERADSARADSPQADAVVHLDHGRLVSDIEREARRLRQEGVFPPGFERELDQLFARFSPPAAVADLDSVITSAEELAFVNADVPVASEKSAGLQVKKGIRKLVYWYVNYVTDQVKEFAVVAARALRLLNRRLERVEHAVPATNAAVTAEALRLPAPVDLSGWAEAVCALLTDVPGRVAHGECGVGELVVALTSAGVDAYGVDPRVGVLPASVTGDLEVRDDDVLEHLRLVPGGGLGGVVLTGCVERYPLGWQLALIDEGERALAPGGRLVVVSASPDVWGAGRTAIAADLSPGRPLHAATWEYLLTERGFDDVRVETDATSGSALIAGARPIT